VVIEDSGVGVASGVAAGMKVLALGRSSSVPQTFVGETWKVDDLSEIDFDREFT
jgi:beta-phosphoglucomutase-like phosphatase (HAD superfamily)